MPRAAARAEAKAGRLRRRRAAPGSPSAPASPHPAGGVQAAAGRRRSAEVRRRHGLRCVAEQARASWQSDSTAAGADVRRKWGSNTGIPRRTSSAGRAGSTAPTAVARGSSFKGSSVSGSTTAGTGRRPPATAGTSAAPCCCCCSRAAEAGACRCVCCAARWACCRGSGRPAAIIAAAAVAASIAARPATLAAMPLRGGRAEPGARPAVRAVVRRTVNSGEPSSFSSSSSSEQSSLSMLQLGSCAPTSDTVDSRRLRPAPCRACPHPAAAPCAAANSSAGVAPRAAVGSCCCAPAVLAVDWRRRLPVAACCRSGVSAAAADEPGSLPAAAALVESLPALLREAEDRLGRCRQWGPWAAVGALLGPCGAVTTPTGPGADARRATGLWLPGCSATRRRKAGRPPGMPIVGGPNNSARSTHLGVGELAPARAALLRGAPRQALTDAAPGRACE